MRMGQNWLHVHVRSYMYLYEYTQKTYIFGASSGNEYFATYFTSTFKATNVVALKKFNAISHEQAKFLSIFHKL